MFGVIQKNRQVEEDDYIESLNQCHQIAINESNLLAQKIVQIEHFLRNSIDELQTLISKYKDPDLQDVELQNLLKVLNALIEERLFNGMSEILHSLEKKKNNLAFFTVTLFGRTKAGKSTIREALTGGNGETIGKGEQRATRDIHRYSWNHLQIIDTPGIAAYKGEEDVKIADSVIDESDLILFLVTSDSIQDIEFKKLVEIKAQNKPIIILLNVKEDIEHPVRLKRLLSRYRDIVSLSGQQGNIRRIRELSKQYFGNSDIEIIPIHARAAFESNRASDEKVKQQLHSVSMFDTLKCRLRQVVVGQGRQKRTQTFRDDHIFYLNSLHSIYWGFYKKLKPRISHLKKKHFQMVKWFDSFIPESNERIETEVSNLFSHLYLSVDQFVDHYAGSSYAKDEWHKKVIELGISEKSEAIIQGLKNEVNSYLEEFSRQLDFEMKNLNFDNWICLESVKKGVIGKVARWGGAFVVIAVNIWNPVGWVGTVIGLGTLILNLFGWFCDDDSKRYEKEKQKAKQQLTRQIEIMERNTKRALKNWFYTNITRGLKKKLKHDLITQLRTLGECCKTPLKAHQYIQKSRKTSH